MLLIEQTRIAARASFIDKSPPWIGAQRTTYATALICELLFTGPIVKREEEIPANKEWSNSTA